MSDRAPGPWMLDSDGRVISADNRFVAYPGMLNLSARKANARLIAAAPDLLDIAKLFQRSIEYEIRKSKNENDEEGARLKTFTLNMVSAAIAKAEGGAP